MRMTVSQARAQMREALDKVKAGEEVEITQNGEVVAVWVHPSTRKPIVRTANTLTAERLHETLERTRRERPLVATPGISAKRAEELVEALRDERDEDRPHQ